MASDELEVWAAPDTWIASYIRHLRGWPLDEYVSPGLIKQWRGILHDEAVKVGRARRAGRDPYPPRLPRRSAEEISVKDVVLDMVRSPHGQAGIAILLAMPVMLHGLATGAARLAVTALRSDVRHEAAPTYSYVVNKVGGVPWRQYWGSRGTYVVGPDGRGRRLPAPNMGGCLPLHRAAINAATPARVRSWRDRLAAAAAADIAAELDAVMAELDEVGAAAIQAADPLPIWVAEAGEPRGLLPDPSPPPVEDVAPGVAAAGAGERPPFVPRRGGVS